MIYRKWSLLTMPVVVLSGLGAVILTHNFVFGANSRLSLWCSPPATRVGVHLCIATGFGSSYFGRSSVVKPICIRERFFEKIKREGEMLRQQDRAKMALEKAKAP